MNYNRPVPDGMDGLAFRRGEEARNINYKYVCNPYHDRVKRRSWYSGYERRDDELAADTAATVQT